MLRKSLFVLALAVGFCTSAMAYTNPPDRVGKWEAGVTVSVAESQDSELDTTGNVSGNVAYGVNEWLALGVSAGWQSHNSDAFDGNGVSIESVNFTAIPIFGDIIFRIPTGESVIKPYGVLGLGVVVWNADDASATVNGTNFDVQTDIDTEFALKLAGGFDWFINDNWAFTFEGGYVFSNPNADVNVIGPANTPGVSADVDLDYWYVGGGIKYQFN